MCTVVFSSDGSQDTLLHKWNLSVARIGIDSVDNEMLTLHIIIRNQLAKQDLSLPLAS